MSGQSVRTLRTDCPRGSGRTLPPFREDVLSAPCPPGNQKRRRKVGGRGGATSPAALGVVFPELSPGGSGGAVREGVKRELEAAAGMAKGIAKRLDLGVRCSQSLPEPLIDRPRSSSCFSMALKVSQASAVSIWLTILHSVQAKFTVVPSPLIFCWNSRPQLPQGKGIEPEKYFHIAAPLLVGVGIPVADTRWPFPDRGVQG